MNPTHRNGEKSPPSCAGEAVVEEESVAVAKHKLEELAVASCPDTANGDQHATKTNGVNSHEQVMYNDSFFSFFF